MVDFTDPSNVQTTDLVVAHPTGAVLEAPKTNSALQLADALANTNEHLPGLLQDIAQDWKTRAEAKAQADALKTHGMAFADAVRQGLIEPTQNPWYMQAYARNAAQVQGQAAVSDLVTQSQQWAERNDPTAYANRFSQELGKIASQPQFLGIDGSAGFNKAAQPLREEALTGNLEYNVQRVNKENTQNATTLATSAIERTLQANPKATPTEIWAATEEGHRQWINTGGTEPAWNLLLANSVFGAASNRGDPALLEILKDNRGGKGALADIADETGKPIGAQVDQYAYYIERSQEAQANAAIRQHQAQIEKEGFAVNRAFVEKYGDDLLFGKVPLHDLQTYARQQGFSVEAVQWAVAQQAKALSESDTYARAQVEQYGLNPTSAVENLKLHARAMREGLSPALQGDIFDRVARGEMDLREGNQILQEADSTMKWQVSQGRADKAEARQDARAERSFKLETARDLKLYGDTSLSTVANTLHQVGDDMLEKNVQQRQALERTIRDAVAATYAKTQDPLQAQTAGDDAAAKWLLNRQKQRRPGFKAQGQGANPRASPP